MLWFGGLHGLMKDVNSLRNLRSSGRIRKSKTDSNWKNGKKIADAIEVKRGSKYPSAAVQKKFKEMLKKGSTARKGPASPLNDEE